MNITMLLQEPFEFSPYHKSMREPFDYFMFGQNYIRPLVDFRLANDFYISLYIYVSVAYVHLICKVSREFWDVPLEWNLLF